MNCTCEAGYQGEVIHCPLHRAAEDMYEALKGLLIETSILDNEQCDHYVGICWCSYKNARFAAKQALAKAGDK